MYITIIAIYFRVKLIFSYNFSYDSYLRTTTFLARCAYAALSNGINYFQLSLCIAVPNFYQQRLQQLDNNFAIYLSNGWISNNYLFRHWDGIS